MGNPPRVSPRTAGAKAAARKQAAEIELERLDGGASIAAASSKSKPLRVLRALFDMGAKVRELDPLHRARAVAAMAKNLEEVSGPFEPSHFNMKDWHEMAELIAHHFETMPGLSATSLRSFMRKETRKGHESALGGLLFHHFVRGNKQFWKDLRDTSRSSVDDLNASLKQRKARALVNGPDGSKPARLVDGRGEPVNDSGAFDAKIRRGYDVVMVLRKKGTSGESADDVYEHQATDDVLFTTAKREDGEYTLFTAEVETKTAGAAGGFGKQLSEAQARYGEVELVSIRFQTDSGVRKLAARDLVFDLHDNTRYAVSAFSKDRWRDFMRVAQDVPFAERIKDFSEARLQGTAKGGFYRKTPSGRRIELPFYFPRLDLAVESAGFARLSRAAMSAIAK